MRGKDRKGDMERRNRDIDRRCRRLKNGHRRDGPIVYLVSRDQRAGDNWALLWAQQEALIRQKGLLVVFCLIQHYLGAHSRHYAFMLKGMEAMQKTLAQLQIPFVLFEGSPQKVLPGFLRRINAHALVTDFDPLRIKQQWKKQLLEEVAAPVFEVDTHNIIPAWLVSEKKEYAAYTLRPKIKRLLDDYLTDIPILQVHPFAEINVGDSTTLPYRWKLDSNQPAEYEFPAGERAAQAAAEKFITSGLANYADQRNNPCMDGQSGLSPYLHFGHLSPQRLAIRASQSGLSSEQVEPFLEELVVRRELSDNFCLYEPQYDSFAGFPEWAQKTLNAHRDDPREYVYSLQEFEAGKTHEQLWNACQADLVRNGKLHGYLRMYWAKKILEWTPDPETALEYAITLNDRYSLDGRDPNGYAGIAWSIGGVHDRAWRERPVFGKIRYMNEAGCRRKFDVTGYIASVLS